MFSRFILLPILLAMTCIARAQGTDESPLIVEDVQCRGNTATSCEYILNHLYLAHGGRVDEEEIANARFRLSALTNFSTVRIYLEKGSERGRAIVIVEVTEARQVVAESFASFANHGSMAIGGRLGLQNLFGAGERLELTAHARFPVDGPVESEATAARLQYVDPTVFGSSRYFFIAGVQYVDVELESRFDDDLLAESTGIDLTLGRRLWDFSYLSLGYRYLPSADFSTLVVREDGTLKTERSSLEHVLLLNYGWNSEDDPYFPTQGGRFQLAVTYGELTERRSSEPEDDNDLCCNFQMLVGYRHTWATGRQGFWSLELGTPGTETDAQLGRGDGPSIGYSRTLAKRGWFEDIERGRWYVDGVVKSFALSDSQATIVEGGLRFGVRFETRSLGVVDLSFLATTEF